jgi:curved DNA-binding protein CbpA
LKKNLYDLVGVPPQAPREMIGAACKRRIAKLEREGGEGAQAGIYAIREAWSILGDAGLRAGYDASLATAKPDTAAAPAVDPLVAHLAPAMLATELLKPRHLWSERWERWRKLVFVMLFVGLFALSAAWNQGNRTAKQKMLEAAEYEAEHGEPPPPRKAEAAKPATAPAEEPFSAEKFERELKEREAAIQEQVAKEQTAKEDEFREKLNRENDPYASRRRPRTR